MTARSWDEIPERQSELNQLYSQLFPVRPVEDAPPPRPQGTPPPDDQALIDRAHRAKNAGGFARLWRGDTSGHHDDDSSADLALCNHLAFWAGPDPARIDRLFRQSRLYRTKWERPSYREPTIAKALAGRTEFYAWGERGDVDSATFDLDGDEATDAEAGAPALSQNPNDYDLTDTGNGEFFAALYTGQFRFDHRRGKWYRWSRFWWRGESDRHARLHTKNIARLRMRAAAEIEDETRRKAALAWAKTTQSKAKRDALLSHAADEPSLAADGDDWDTDPYLLGAGNGAIDLRTGILHPGHPLDRISLRSPVPFDPYATAPRWERFLMEVFRDDAPLVAWLRRMIGYTLTGDISEHAFVVCFGAGSNGKSTLFTLLGHILGDYGGALNFSALAHAEYESHPTEIAALDGKRFVTASELNEGQRLNEARIKALTGGDLIKARFMRQDEFEFRPVLKLWLAVNHKPVVKDDSRGFWRRMRLLPFTREFPINHDLEGELRAEAPGILNWAVRGCLEWQTQGLGTAETIEQATKSYREDSDPLIAFVADCCTVGEQFTVRASHLFKAYEEWATEQGQRERELLTSTMFGRRVGERYPKQRDSIGNFYKGIAIASTWEARDSRPARFTPD